MNQILDAWSIIFNFSLIVNFYLTKAGNRTENSLLMQLQYYCFENRYYFFPEYFDFFQNKC